MSYCSVAVIQLEFRNINLYPKTSEAGWWGDRNLTGKIREITSSVKFYIY